MRRLISICLILAGAGALLTGLLGMIGDSEPDKQAVPFSKQADSSPVLAVPEAGTEEGSAKPSAKSSSGLSFITPTGGQKTGSPDISELDDRVEIASAGQAFADRLRTVPIAHETPREARFGRPFEVYVALDGTGGSSAAAALPGRGTIVESEAQISDRVQASLSGPSFELEPLTPLIQRVSPMTENVWRWRVTPFEVGAQDLVIELFALDEDEAMPVRTFRDTVEVRVSRIGQIVALAQSVSPVAMVAGGIGSLLAGLLGLLRLFRVGT